MNHHYQQRGGFRSQHQQEEKATLDLDAINLAQPAASLFDEVAEAVAKKIAQPEGRGRDLNKGTQLRGFYDELVMWEQKSRRMTEAEFEQHLPLIRMINAKVAYAKGRELVDINYLALMKHCLGQVNSPASLRNCKLFMEAFMGFFKLYGKK